MPGKKERHKWSISTAVMVTAFFAAIIFLIFVGWREVSPFHSLLPLFLVGTMLVHFYFFVLGGWNKLPLVYKNKSVIFDDGVVGAAEGNIETEYAGMSSLLVAVRKCDCPEDIWFRLPGTRGFFAWISGMVHLNITRPSSKFRELPSEECGIPEGAIRVYTGLDENKLVKTDAEVFKDKLDYLESVLSKINTKVQTAISEASRDAQTGSKTIVDTMHTIAPILRELLIPSLQQQPKQPPQGMM